MNEKLGPVNPSSRRPHVPVTTLACTLPKIPRFKEEGQLDPSQVASEFLTIFKASILGSQWEAFGELFTDEGWWRDGLTLTFDKRTFHGRRNVVQAWKALSSQRKPSDWSLEMGGTGLPFGNPKWVRMTPTLAYMEVPCTFQLQLPGSICVGVFKLVPEVHQGSEVIKWRIWILSTTIISLIDQPFQKLPRSNLSSTNNLIDTSQRGQVSYQGLPKIKQESIFDAVVVGYSSCGMSNIIQFESIGLNSVAFDCHPEAGGEWAGRYESVQIHHPKNAVQIPQFAVPSSFQEYMTGKELASYYCQAIHQLQLPCFAGVKVTKNVWSEEDNYWTSTLQDVRTWETMKIRSRNLVMSNGYMLAKKRLLNLPGEKEFQGSISHSSDVEGPEPYKDRNVLIVGSGNSAHDIAGMITRSGLARSVSLLQRSPSGLAEHDQVMRLTFAPYFTDAQVDVLDIVRGGDPTAVSFVMASGLTSTLNRQNEELYRRLEEKGYLIDRHWNLVQRAYEERGRSLYMDNPRVFDLVFDDKIRILRGSAVEFVSDGLVTRYQNDEAKIVKTDAVIYATGYANLNLAEEWIKSDFLDTKSAKSLEDIGCLGVDKEGELIGYITASGHPHLYFAAVNLPMARWISKLVAIQIAADVTRTSPTLFPRL